MRHRRPAPEQSNTWLARWSKDEVRGVVLRSSLSSCCSLLTVAGSSTCPAFAVLFAVAIITIIIISHYRHQRHRRQGTLSFPRCRFPCLSLSLSPPALTIPLSGPHRFILRRCSHNNTRTLALVDELSSRPSRRPTYSAVDQTYIPQLRDPFVNILSQACSAQPTHLHHGRRGTHKVQPLPPITSCFAFR